MTEAVNLKNSTLNIQIILVGIYKIILFLYYKGRDLPASGSNIWADILGLIDTNGKDRSLFVERCVLLCLNETKLFYFQQMSVKGVATATRPFPALCL